jgi:hypothetical protein
MLRVKTTKVIAAGPLFQDNDDPTTRRRALLITRREDNAKSPEYLLGIQTLPEGDLATRRLRTRQRTHAVRFFCDFLLDQAVREDWAVDAMFSTEQAGLE